MRPFEIFLSWLEKAGRAWETVFTFGAGKKERNESEHLMFHAEVRSGQGRTCYSCGKEGHFRNICPDSFRCRIATSGGKKA